MTAEFHVYRERSLLVVEDNVAYCSLTNMVKCSETLDYEKEFGSSTRLGQLPYSLGR